MSTTPRSFLGVDFGTSHTVAVVRRVDGRVEPLLFDSSPLLPSAVFATADGSLLVGRDAVDSARTDPASFEPNPKRRIDDGSVLLGAHDIPIVALFTAVLDRVRRECVQVLGEAPSVVTLTYPAAWGSARRLALQDAAEAAGLPEPLLVPEPVAAATYFAQYLEHDIPVGSAVVVHDFGGGTFDASVVRRTETGFDVLSVDGLNDLGGVDVDAAIISFLRARFDRPELWERLLAPTTATDRRLRRTFVEDVRLVKERLSRQTSADLHLPLFDMDVHLTREELEELTGPMLSRAVRLVHAVVRASGQPEDAIAGLFLVGGSSRMPLVATLLHRELGTAPVVVDQIEQVVAHGALLSAMGVVSEGSAPVTPPPSAVGPPFTPFAYTPSPPVSPPTMVSPVSVAPPEPMTPQPMPVQAVPVDTPVPFAPAPPRASSERWGRFAAAAVGAVVLIGVIILVPWLTQDDGGADDGRTGTPPGSNQGSEENSGTAPDAVYAAHEWSIEAIEVIDVDGRAVVVTGAHTDPIRVWDAVTGDDISTFEGHDETHDNITAVASAKLEDRTVMASIAWGSEVLIWDPADGAQIRDIQVPDMGTVGMLATGEFDGAPVVVGATTWGFEDDRKTTVYVWDLATGDMKYEWTVGIDTGSMRVVTIDGTARVVLSGLDKDLKPISQIRSFGTGELVDSVKLGGGEQEVAWHVASASADGESPIVLTNTPGGPIEVWDMGSGERVVEFTEHTADIAAMDVTMWGDRVVAVSADGNDVFYVWDVATGSLIAEYSLDAVEGGTFGHTGSPDSTACAVVDGNLIVAGSAFVGFLGFTWSLDAEQALD
ncbi:Hsp70 family protein [Stackebrandtia soli]|uniref:Hsp70 family protein n=1 Tax=Stackebrandtia soli TaxID=1892856 RepID=UPI0039EB8D8D